MITSGPWKDIVDQAGGLWVVGPDHKSWVDPDGFVRHTGAICYFGDMEDTTPEDHANAEAVASLPSLVKACRAMLDALAEYGDVGWYDAPGAEDGLRPVSMMLNALPRTGGGE